MNYKISLIECRVVDMLPEAQEGEDRSHLADKRAIRVAALDVETSTEDHREVLYADSSLFMQDDEQARGICTGAALRKIGKEIAQHEQDKAKLKIIQLN